MSASSAIRNSKVNRPKRRPAARIIFAKSSLTQRLTPPIAQGNLLEHSDDISQPLSQDSYCWESGDLSKRAHADEGAGVLIASGLSICCESTWRTRKFCLDQTVVGIALGCGASRWRGEDDIQEKRIDSFDLFFQQSSYTSSVFRALYPRPNQIFDRSDLSRMIDFGFTLS